MQITTTDKATVQKQARNKAHVYLLLNTRLLEDKAYKPLAADAIEFPPVKNIKQLISDIDKFTWSCWVWEESIRDDQKEQGPILVKVDVESEPESDLLTHFTAKWANQNGGILLTSDYSLDQLQQHLRSLMILANSGGATSFSIHRPQQLTTIFAVLEQSRGSEMLGPIEAMFWLENCGSASSTYTPQWYQATNLQPHTPQHQETEWFYFETSQTAEMNRLAEIWYQQSLLHTIQADIEQGDYKGQTLNHLKQYSATDLELMIKNGIDHSRKIGIKDQTLMQQYIQMTLYCPEKVRTDSVQEMLANTTLHPNLKIKKARQKVKASEYDVSTT